MSLPLKELWTDVRWFLGMIDWLRAALMLAILLLLGVMVWVISWFL